MKKFIYIVLGISVVLLGIFFYIQSNVNVKDLSTIELYGELEITVLYGDSYTDPGYTINTENNPDDYTIQVNNAINYNVPGTYEIIYSLYNKKNELLDTKSRTVTIEGPKLKDVTFTLNGNEVEYFFINDYKDLGVTATKPGEDLTSKVQVIDKVDSTKTGTYEVLYYLEEHNEKIEKKRTVIIIDNIENYSINLETKRFNINIKHPYYDYLEYDNQKYNDDNIVVPELKNKYQFTIYLKNGSNKKVTINNRNYQDICNAYPVGEQIKLDINIDLKTIKRILYKNTSHQTTSFMIGKTNDNIIINIYTEENMHYSMKCKLRYGNDIKTIVTNKQGFFKCNADRSSGNTELRKIVLNYGNYTRDAVAGAALYLVNYPLNVRYQWGGGYRKIGLDPRWGCSEYVAPDNVKKCSVTIDSNHCEKGLDCSGFVNWAYLQAGFTTDEIPTSGMSIRTWGTGNKTFSANQHKYQFSEANLGVAANIKPGDLVWREGHIGIIIGVSADRVQIASMMGPIIVQENLKKNGHTVGSSQKSFTHFVLMDDFFKMYE